MPVKIEKTEEEIKSIRSKIEKSFIFNACEEKDKKIVIECMEVKEFSSNECIIKQGENGDYFYIIDSGQLDCYK
jgi:cAMP-dependent protein kinase regulator